VLQGQLTHVNTVGNIDQLSPGEFYAFSAGSGGKHCELNLKNEDVHVIYIWIIPDQLLLPPSYERENFDALANRNTIVTLVGNADGALRISQDVKISRLVSDKAQTFNYEPTSRGHGVYAFVLDGEVQCGQTTLGRRDSAGIWGEESVRFRTSPQDADMLIVNTALINHRSRLVCRYCKCITPKAPYRVIARAPLPKL
jgi:redox-sensitive bicupin YhaK (pirin superfamily)